LPNPFRGYPLHCAGRSRTEVTYTDDNCTDRACFEIAGIRIGIVCTEPEMSLSVSGALRKFSVDKADADLNIQVFWGSPDVAANGKKIFDSGALWHLHFDGESYQFRFTSPVFGNLPYKVAIFSPDFTSGKIYLRRNYSQDRYIYPFEYPLDELLFINLLAQGRGVEVHATGLIDPQGNGQLFLGQSGAGKTTMARLWHGMEGVRILSDDRIILRNEQGHIWMYGTPWHGEGLLALPARAPLTRICFLRHALRNALIPQGHAEAAASMFACSFPPFFSAEGIDFTMEFLHGVVAGVPCYELHFLPNESVIEFLTNSPTGNRSQ
jgi:hypothetical protein